MKRVVITGATGFVGANLVEYLVRHGYDVYLFVRKGYKTWRVEHLFSYLQVVHVNLLDRDALFETVKQVRPDWVIHLAAYGAYSWQDDLDSAIQTNFLATVNLLDVCKRVGFEVFINTGSSSEYGVKDHAPSEDTFLDPNSYYAVTKASATMFCRYFAHHFNLPIYTLRLYSVYGPYEDPKRLIPTLIVNGLKKTLPSLVQPDIARDFIYSEDVNTAFEFVASSSNILRFGEVYNIGTGRQTTLREIVAITRDVFDIKEEPKWGSMDNRSWDTSVWFADNEKIAKAGWSPKYEFYSGFQQTIKWFMENPTLVDNIYLK